MKIRFAWPWPLVRLERAPRPPRPAAAAVVPSGVLGAARMVALVAVSVLVSVSTVVALAESYRDLYLWALHHTVFGVWAGAWPLMVDTFVVVGELALFVAMVDQWDVRPRIYAWLVVAGGLTVSVAGNVGHLTTADPWDRVTWAVPPLAAFVSLTIGIGILKRVVAKNAAARLPVDSRTAVEALTAAGITDTGVLAALIGVTDRQIRRLRAPVPDAATAGADAAAVEVRTTSAPSQRRHAAGQPRQPRAELVDVGGTS